MGSSSAQSVDNMAVCGVMAACNFSTASTTTSLPPVRRMALSNALLRGMMITSFLSPVVSGPRQVRVLEVVAVVLPIRSLVDELRATRIAGSPQFEPAGQNRFQKKYFATNCTSRLSRVVDEIVPKEPEDAFALGAPNWGVLKALKAWI
jgi:hypothetical protein